MFHDSNLFFRLVWNVLCCKLCNFGFPFHRLADKNGLRVANVGTVYHVSTFYENDRKCGAAVFGIKLGLFSDLSLQLSEALRNILLH